MNIPADIIILWPSTNASIPTGFVRETAFDGKYPKGANGSNQNTTGGAATHTHTSPAHTHDIGDHIHTYNIPDINDPSGEHRNGGGGGLTTYEHHTHFGQTATSEPGTTASATPTYGAAPNDPPFVEVIFIKGDGAHDIPDNAILFISSALPTNYVVPTALKNNYVKGAAAAGDGGGTGGAYTHVHDLTHSHTGGSHGHGETISSTANPYTHDNNNPSSIFAFSGNHNHTFTPASTVVTPNAFSGNLSPTEHVEPNYKKILPVQKQTGGLLTSGLIGLWLGAIVDIPAGWQLCNGSNGMLDLRDFHIKCANDATEVNTTGGANTHTHAAQAHDHTAPSHTHAVGALAHAGSLDAFYGSEGADLYNYQTHAPFNLDAVTIAYKPANTTADASNNEPSYLRAHFIMFNKIYAQQSVALAYKVRINRELVIPLQYKIKRKNSLVVPLEYAIRTINWELIPKPEL